MEKGLGVIPAGSWTPTSHGTPSLWQPLGASSGLGGKNPSYSLLGIFPLCHLEAAAVGSFRGTAPGMKVCLPAN